MKQCRKCLREFPLSAEYFYVVNKKFLSRCKSCWLRSLNEWREKNRDRHNATAKKWRDNNPEKLKESNRKCHKKNGRKYLSKKKAWASNNRLKVAKSRELWMAKDPIRARAIIAKAARARYKKHPEKYSAIYKKWRQAHPEKIIEFSKRRRARKLGAPINDFTAEQWVALQIAFAHRCAYCKKRMKGRLTQDHIIPLSKGGSHTVNNIVPACSSCNSKKHVGPPPCTVQPLLL